LFCTASVTGANLKKRIEAIMTNSGARSLELAKKLLLAATGISVVVGPLMFGLLSAPRGGAQPQAQSAPPPAPPFEIVSLKSKPRPSVTAVIPVRVLQHDRSLEFTNQSLKQLIRFAYELPDTSQISGGPDWIDSQLYDHTATMNGPTDNVETRSTLQRFL